LWDISKAFDSGSRPLIIRCWQRLGVSTELVEWLVALDLGCHAIIRSNFALEIMKKNGLEAFPFSPEQGTEQGDIQSSFTWLADFDVFLYCLLRIKIL